MAIYCDEDQMGRDDAVIGFPHLLLCMGLVLRTANDIWGVHLTATQASSATFNAFWAYAMAKGLTAAAITDVYSSCNLSIRYSAATPAGQQAIWTGEMTNYAQTMGWHGNVWRFDTGVLAPTDGTYVEYRHQAQGAHGCHIHYKKNEKTLAGATINVNAAGGQGDFVAFSSHNRRLRPSAGMKTAINVTTNGGLRELDYNNRLVAVVV